ncbi:uncharacterized protein [Panulirus ornatus]|uniref:uncharacterized protein isoform X1 n=1 Tax=Panulirus ornatus TaxID=150431 RepID=UPI003A8863E9
MELDSKADIEIFQTFELSDGARTVTILASKEEEERINQDQEYATQRFLSAVSEEGEEDFSYNATLLLIECIRDRFEKFCSSRQERNQVYKEIQEELRSYSYNLPLDKIRSKWSNLITTYKRIKDRHKAGSPGRRLWDYFQPLDDLLGPTFETAGLDGLSMLAVKPHIIKSSSHQASSAPTIIQKVSGSPELSSTPPLVCSPALPQSTVVAPSSNNVPEAKRKTSDSASVIIDQAEKGERRQDMMEQYFHQLKDKETKEENYRRRKERRERMKLRALQKIGRELQSIAKIQLEILKKQDLILEA